jgi:hypothetical protein
MLPPGGNLASHPDVCNTKKAWKNELEKRRKKMLFSMKQMGIDISKSLVASSQKNTIGTTGYPRCHISIFALLVSRHW